MVLWDSSRGKKYGKINKILPQNNDGRCTVINSLIYKFVVFKIKK